MAKSKNFYHYILLLVFISCTAFQSDIRQRIKTTYSSQVGIREKTGHNDGAEVEQYLKYVGLKKGQSWCAAFVCWVLGKSGVKNPKAGGCASLLEKGQSITYKSGREAVVPPQRADVFFIWYASKNRVAHTGFIEKWGQQWVETIEGNTNDAGSREGDGVYRKKRLRRQVYAVINYVP